MQRCAPTSSTRKAMKRPCSGAICMRAMGSFAVSARRRASTSGSCTVWSSMKRQTASVTSVVRVDMGTPLRLGSSLGHVFGGGRRALTEEVLLALRHPDALAVLAGEVEAVLVDQHLGVLEPLAPGLLRDVLEHTL